MCSSLWPDAREATVYFPYPQKDVNLERSGPLPVAADLGARRLAYRCTWERNCIKNAFGLAGFRRVKDGTELRALKGVRGEASPDGSGSGLADFVGGLLGLAPTGAAGGKKKGKKALDAHVTKLPWCASWTKHPGAEVYATQRRHQRVNHFPGSWCIGRKDRLLRCLGRARSRGGTAAKAYAFMPEGYILPGEARALEGKAKLDKHAVWIVKPPASSRGRGIRLATSRELTAGTLPKEKKYVVRYVDAPFLGVNGRKFDLRLYALVTSVDPLVVYVHEDGLRFSTPPYTMRNLRCRYVHLTNYSVNKKSKRYVEADGDGAEAADADDDGGDDDDGDDDDDEEEAAALRTRLPAAPTPRTSWPLQALWRWLDAHGHDAAAVRARCHDLVVKTLIAAEAELTPHNVRACRAARPAGAAGAAAAVLRASRLRVARRDLRPWLIEVNISPSLMGNSVLDWRIKGRLVVDVSTRRARPFSTKAARKEARAARRDRLDRSRAGGPARPAGGAGAQQDAWRRRPARDVALERLGPDDWDVVCHAEDELRRARSGGCARGRGRRRSATTRPTPTRAGRTRARAGAGRAGRQGEERRVPAALRVPASRTAPCGAAQLPVRKPTSTAPRAAEGARPAAARAEARGGYLSEASSVCVSAGRPPSSSRRASCARARPRRSTPAAAGLAARAARGPGSRHPAAGVGAATRRRRARRQRGRAAPEAAAAAAVPRHRQDRRGDRLPPRQGRETGGADARGPVPHCRRERLVVF